MITQAELDAAKLAVSDTGRVTVLAHGTVQRLIDAIEKLRAGLEWYRDCKQWDDYDGPCVNMCILQHERVRTTGGIPYAGKRARQVLAEVFGEGAT